MKYKAKTPSGETVEGQEIFREGLFNTFLVQKVQGGERRIKILPESIEVLDGKPATGPDGRSREMDLERKRLEIEA